MPGYQQLRGLDKQEVRSLLDVVAREGAQRMLIGALEQEVEEFFGRARYEHRVGRRSGYRNGVGKPRKIAVGCGTLEIRAPRVRETDEPFRSQLLPRYQRSSEAVRALLPELYLQGLATGDFEPALRALLGEAGPTEPRLDRSPQRTMAGGVRGVETSPPRAALCVLLGRRLISESRPRG